MPIARRLFTTVDLDGRTWETNIMVRPMESRPDWQAPEATGSVFVLRDLWTQVGGSADTWPQWARDDYLKEWSDPCANTSAGGDTHLFAVARAAGEPCGALHGKSFIGWTDGFGKLGDPGYQGYVSKRADESHGWVNWFDSNGYFPDQGQRGPWCWCPLGRADVVDGGGLPFRHHVSFFAAWERMTYADYLAEQGGVVTPPPPLPGDGDIIARLERIEQRVMRLVDRFDDVFLP